MSYQILNRSDRREQTEAAHRAYREAEIAAALALCTSVERMRSAHRIRNEAARLATLEKINSDMVSAANAFKEAREALWEAEL